MDRVVRWDSYDSGWDILSERNVSQTLLLHAVTHARVDDMLILLKHEDININLGVSSQNFSTPLVAAVGLSLSLSLSQQMINSSTALCMADVRYTKGRDSRVFLSMA